MSTPLNFLRRPGGVTYLLCGLFLACFQATLRGDDAVGLVAPEGFTVSKFAPDDLAHDIYCMTLDTAGRVVVSGPGYVKILIDTDGDGNADSSKTFVDGPKTGAQGMFFLGRDLFCVGDEGLIRYQDADGDDRADGPPQTFLKIKTGSEHHAHAIRRGPDGWWYLIAGNFADVNGGYATEPTSPIKTPHGGVVMRLKPELSGGEIVADGFRNAYDFDFDPQGEILSYDSDGERDISLPWYLPTRVLHILPGGEEGWITESWKRPNYFLDAPPVVASTGRGSPTGVACYQHTQFPAKYRNALFVLDWTFGRVLTVPLIKQGATFAPQQAEDFLTASGQQGFAPTDVEVGVDGSLYVCVGGRGTHGTVYRVTYTGNDADVKPPLLLQVDERSSAEQRLAACLDPIQPQSSWARSRWVPLATKLGARPFLEAALNERLEPARRVRAIQILVDLFDGLPANALQLLASSKAPDVRATAAWSVGFQRSRQIAVDSLAPYLADTDGFVRRRALESIARIDINRTPLLKPLARCLNDDDREVRLATSRLIPQMPPNQVRQLAEYGRELGWRASLSSTIGYVWRTQLEGEGFNAFGVDFGRRVIVAKHPPAMKLEAARLIQMSLGDLGGRGGTPGMFHSYTGTQVLDEYAATLDPLRESLVEVFPTGDRLVDIELARVMAMLSSKNSRMLDKLLGQIGPKTNPVDDIHYLACAARVDVAPTDERSQQLAEALVAIDRKFAERKLPRDNNWDDRVGELFAELANRDPGLPVRIVKTRGFGRPTHVVFTSKLQENESSLAVSAFTRAVKADKNYPWTTDVVYLVGMGATDEGRELVRAQFENFELRLAVLVVLSEVPEEQDRPLFAQGLDAGPMEVLTACVSALEKLPEARDALECVSLVKLLRRLGNDKAEYALRERVVQLLKRNSGEESEFVFGAAGYQPQAEAINRWTDWATSNFPAEAKEILGANSEDIESLRDRLARVDWEEGDAERGAKLFTSRACGQCHGSGKALGPDLAGVAGRFSKDDLFVAIALPNRDVSPRYQTMLVETKAGKIYTGLVVYESVDGILLRNGTNQTYRIEGKDIASKRNLPNSLMPEGLLKDLKDSDLADLYAYLRSLSNRTAAKDDSTARE
ncbi:MAG: HEAT repeat domain-containing protein [Planctomycetota bacterium]|nr:HEAT repeat domain-containing protein [Planctomycetota bacterium]